jgi:hypothetical protein
MRTMVEKKMEKPTPVFEKTATAPKFPAASHMMADFDVSKLFSEMKAPAMPDMAAVLATHKRNLEALADANRVAMEGAQALARRHFEIMQSTMAGMTDSLKSMRMRCPIPGNSAI